MTCMRIEKRRASRAVASIIIAMLAAFAGFAALTSLAGCSAGAGAAASADQGITVSASSDMKVVPDKARVSVSVLTEDKDAQACQDANATSVNAVIDALKKLGVEDESIQTSYSNLSPRYGSRVTDVGKVTTGAAESTEGASSGDDGVAYDEWVITGYEMNTSLTVSDLDIDNVGAAISACVAAGANRTDGVEYYASAYDETYEQALQEAMEVARSKAETIATASGAHLGKVLDVDEGYQDVSSRYVATADALDAEEAAGAVVAKTMPGQIDISARVTVTYAIA